MFLRIRSGKRIENKEAGKKSQAKLWNFLNSSRNGEGGSKRTERKPAKKKKKKLKGRGRKLGYWFAYRM